MNKKLYSKAEAAKLSGKPWSTVIKYAIEHDIQKIGIQYVFTIDQIEEIKKIPDRGKFLRSESIREHMSEGQKKRRKKGK